MLQPRKPLHPRSIELSSLSSLVACLNALTLCSRHTASPIAFLKQISVRNASHAAQGRANGPKDSAGRRLGAKKSDSEFVVPGNIIFKQRGMLCAEATESYCASILDTAEPLIPTKHTFAGTKWFPGENTDIGKDHTIYATVQGYVRYYRDPIRHPKRRYIGVALEREGPLSKLPTPRNAPTRRRLGMYAAPIKQVPENFLESHLSPGSIQAGKPEVGDPTVLVPAIIAARDGVFRKSNYEIGKAAEVKGAKVRPYDRGDRWLAWRKRAKKVKAAQLARAAKATRKTKGKKSNKGVTKSVKK